MRQFFFVLLGLLLLCSLSCQQQQPPNNDAEKQQREIKREAKNTEKKAKKAQKEAEKERRRVANPDSASASVYGKIHRYNSWGYKRAEKGFTIKTQEAIKRYSEFTGKSFSLKMAEQDLCIVDDYYVFYLNAIDKLYRTCRGVGVNGTTGKVEKLTIHTK